MITKFSSTYSQIRNTASIGGSGNKSVLQSGAKDTQREYHLYEDDKNTQINFPKYVGTDSPIWESLRFTDSDYYDNDKYDKFDQGFHAYQKINKFKVCDIAVVSAANQDPLTLTHNAWGNWRQNNYAGVKVSNNVFLWPQDKNFNFSYTNEYGNAWEKLSSTGLLSKVQQGAELLRTVAAATGASNVDAGGKLISKYVRAPNWKDTSPVGLDSALKFEFNFGQAGIFSGEQEVVKPILALASLFAPIQESGDQNVGYLQGPVPTPPSYLVHYFQKLASDGAGAIQDGFKHLVGGGGSSDSSSDESSGESKDFLGQVMGVVTDGIANAASAVTSLEKALISIQQDAIRTTLEEEKSRALCLRLGRMSIGPYLVKTVNWGFDFTHVDEYGYPYKGFVSFSGLENITVAETSDIAKPFIKNS